MEKIKKFFNINEKYRFEWNDIRAVLTLINFILILFSFSVGAIFGISIAFIGLIKDFVTDRHISSIVMHFISFLLNGYILFFL